MGKRKSDRRKACRFFISGLYYGLSAHKIKPRKHLLAWFFLVTRTGIELNFCCFLTYRNISEMAILRGFSTFGMFWFCVKYRDFSYQ